MLRTAFGYAVLLGVSLWIPAGLHRVVMGRRDWWHFAVSHVVLVLGVVGWITMGRHGLGVVALLGGGAWWFSLVVTDFFQMWTWHWPFQSSVGEYLGALDQRLNLKPNLSLFVIVAVAMLFLAHVA
ncbi:hypothetical protein DF156_22355 [Burkholderia ubonensis]|nr:hypothetical protein CJO66_10600 [Burkholderia ubonensis]RQQ13174.1 hypothetical protein DF161_19845 [Burkholderia stagnalis]RQP31048.1 hypothetical protein DF155_21425 [Burkholderia ubonensis]RQP33944.1 hypothetical protein DF154_25155 [Burkholderia ubonensis]RQP36770.1 hypothetical protein DF156_22355 [Burkholderia ubonensis]